MDYVAVCLTALVASALTLFSGFGLGTILTPVMALFFPVEAAVAMTAAVHFANNLFKLALFGRKADRGVVVRFGIPALAASFLGAGMLVSLSGMPVLATWELWGRHMAVTPVKLLMGVLIAGFAVMELTPVLRRVSVSARWLPLGGAVSGFFGGLSGHQGAFRSAFLLQAGLHKEAFIATGVVAACLVDASRLTVYGELLFSRIVGDNAALAILATLSAFLGALAGKRFVPKVTIGLVRAMVGTMLLFLAAALAVGLV